MTDRPDGPPFADAEAWLAARGVRREALVVRPPAADPAAPTVEGPPDQPAGQPGVQRADRAAHSPANRPPREPGQEPAREPAQEPAQPPLEDQVAAALRYARRSTAAAPRSEARLLQALERRFPPVVAAVALQRARAHGIVDDRAFAVALVDDARRRGHAPLRIRTTLERRGFPPEIIDPVMAAVEDTDPEAAAFALARRRVGALRTTDPETAFRRLVGYLARRGYTEALARKVARQAVFHDRDTQRTAER